MTEYLGKTLRDKISGVTGIADQYIEKLSSAPQYALQPPGVGKTLPESWSFDAMSLEVVDGPTVDVVPVDAGVIVKLGDKVRDVIVGTEGVAVRRTTFINGCVFFTVAGQLSKPMMKDDPGTAIVIHKQLEVIDAGWFDRQARPSAAKPAAGNELQGGPRERAYRP